MRRPMFSVVTAAFNVERYVDRYFAALAAQTIGLRESIEVIFVDDGSTDGVAAMAGVWVSRYPDNIRLIRKEHAGVVSARNLGIAAARGDWLTFVDSDDFVARDYFAVVAEFLSRTAAEVALISCRQLVLDEATGKRRDSHPLGYRFQRGERVVDLFDEPEWFQLSVNSAFFRTANVQALSLGFDERVRPTSSDSRFVNEYLLRLGEFKVAFLPKAHYTYTKRADGSSLIDSYWTKKETYFERLKFGDLWLLESYARQYGRPPAFIQRAVLYDLTWFFAAAREGRIPRHFLDEPESERFEEILASIFSLIDAEVIESFDESRLPRFDKEAVLRRFKKLAPSPPALFLGPLDPRRHLARMTYVDDGASCLTVFVNGRQRSPAFETIHERTFNARPFGEERIAWFPFRPGELISARIDGADAPITAAPRSALAWDYESVLTLSLSGADRIKPLRRLIRWLSRTPPIRRLYGGAWVFMDRDNQADNNAEHLYRWISQNAPEIGRRFFVLRRTAPDWKRLKREGFHILPFAGIRHRLALFNAEWLLSSHADETIWSFSHAERYGNTRPPGFAFLQHGVIKDDVSSWLNVVPLDLLVTTSTREAASLLDKSYRLTPREVVVTGLARHDRLLQMCDERRLVVVMPTWRMGLTRSGDRTSDRLAAENFQDSLYRRAWQSILGDQSLAEHVKRAGYQMAFHPHVNMRKHAGAFDLAKDVLPLDRAGRSMQEIFSRVALLITDYSSVAFEAALIGRPVLYFQFDRDSFYREHTSSEGYFDYERDGFGEVCEDATTLAALVRQYVDAGCRMKPKHAARAEAFFAFKDGQNCRRIYDAIQQRSRPLQELQSHDRACSITTR